MSEQTVRHRRVGAEKRPGYLQRLQAIPVETVLGITWQNRKNARAKAAELDEWLDADPAIRRHIRWRTVGTATKYLTWAYTGEHYSGGALIAAIAKAAGVELKPDSRSKTSFQSPVYLLLPADAPYFGRTLDEYADALGYSDSNSIEPPSYRELCAAVEISEPAHADRRVTRIVNEVRRHPKAVAAVLGRCGGTCENPACGGMPKHRTKADEPLLEVDHVDELAAEGRDHPENMIALCPNCHAMKTRGAHADELREIFRGVVQIKHSAAL